MRASRRRPLVGRDLDPWPHPDRPFFDRARGRPRADDLNPMESRVSFMRMEHMVFKLVDLRTLRSRVKQSITMLANVTLIPCRIKLEITRAAMRGERIYRAACRRLASSSAA